MILVHGWSHGCGIHVTIVSLYVCWPRPSEPHSCTQCPSLRRTNICPVNSVGKEELTSSARAIVSKQKSNYCNYCRCPVSLLMTFDAWQTMAKYLRFSVWILIAKWQQSSHLQVLSTKSVLAAVTIVEDANLAALSRYSAKPPSAHHRHPFDQILWSAVSLLFAKWKAYVRYRMQQVRWCKLQRVASRSKGMWQEAW